MPEDLAAAAICFRNIGISSIHPAKQILCNVSGYVIKGGITALLGPSASGKSLFMRALSGRVHDLKVTGDFFIEGDRVDHRDISNSISFVSQEDYLIGDLTPKETLFNSAAMKRNKPIYKVNEDVERLLDVFGLNEVADCTIGTAFVRGLSDGQRKMIDIGTELIAAPSMLFLDEPTSGLDASIAFDVLKSIYDIARASEGRLSILLSIHQPNSRLLELVDNIMVLGNGTMTFFGTVAESVQHLIGIGFLPPDNYSPMDFFLQVSDKNFSSRTTVNFAGNFRSSDLHHNLVTYIDAIAHDSSRRSRRKTQPPSPSKEIYNEDSFCISSEDGIIADYVRYVDSSSGKPSFWRQYQLLVKRDVAMAARDPAMYYLQFLMNLVLGLFIGAVFFKIIEYEEKLLIIVSGSIVWITFTVAYVQVFKVYYLSKASARFLHEKANNTYSVLAAFLAELTTTSIGLLSVIPGMTVTYFMMGFPRESFPFLILLYWMTALTVESILNLISRAWADTTTAIIISQATLALLSPFGGGIFIPWNVTPHYWLWLQEISVFTHSSRAAIMHINYKMTYKCPTIPSFETSYPWRAICLGVPGGCDASTTTSSLCMVKGRTMLYAMQGIGHTDSPWKSFGYLVLIFIVVRCGVLILMHFPADQIISIVRQFVSSGVQEQLNEVQIRNRNLEDQIAAIINNFQPEATTQSVGVGVGVGPKRSISLISECSLYENYNVEELFAEEYKPHGEVGSTGTAEHPFCLVWKNLTLTLKKEGKVLIDNVSGAAYAGRVLALMGPSGAGKTTLLNALGNRAPYGRIIGEVTYGRREFSTSDLYFVPQFDEVNDNLTVVEQIELVGLLKCRNREDMYCRLDIMIRSLGLHGKAKTLCRDLTGGELKIVSVGMGMISNPKVLFLDEPTTGLDSTAAYSIVKHIAELTERFKIAVIMTIHQPAAIVFDMLQDLYILEAGRLAYSGPLSCSKQYFKALGYLCSSNTAAADFFMDVVNRPPTILHQSSWQTLYLNSKFSANFTKVQMALNAASPIAPSSSRPPSETARFRELLRFFFKYYSRDIGFYYQRIMCLSVIAIFGGTLFLQLTPEIKNLNLYAGAVFFNMFTVLFSVIAVTGLLARDRCYLVEQVKNAVISPALYCTAQLIVSIPFNFIAALTFQSIFHWLTNINPNRESFIYSVLITCGHLLLMEAILLTVVEVMKNATLCATFAILILNYLFLFAGFFIQVKDMPDWIRWISSITPTKYSFDGYLFQILHNQKFLIQGSINKAFDFGNTYYYGHSILRDIFNQNDISSSKPWVMLSVLLSWIVLIRFVHCCTLMFQVRHFNVKNNRSNKSDDKNVEA